jgi:hypothetical protein
MLSPEPAPCAVLTYGKSIICMAAFRVNGRVGFPCGSVVRRVAELPVATARANFF